MAAAGTALRDQVITFDITAREAVAANAAQRQRFVGLAEALDDAQWSAASRCATWSVQDVVRHVAQMTGVTLAALAAARAGERFEGFAGFDPRTSPDRMVRAADPQSPAETLRSYRDATADLLRSVGELDLDDDSLLVMTPAGRQPWPRATLHSLFDSAVHERDVAVPLGLPAAPERAELTAVAAYQVLIAARVTCLIGLPLHVELHLDGADPLTAHVDGSAVSVTRRIGTGAVVARGAATTVLDAMTGRGELSAVLDAPAGVIGALSSLGPLI